MKQFMKHQTNTFGSSQQATENSDESEFGTDDFDLLYDIEN
jgi:hypothetical protein